MDDPEQRFLRNQEARLAARHKHSKTQDVHAFWRDLRGTLALWNERLAEISKANDRHAALNELDVLQSDLKVLQKEALSELELPVSDLKLLHNEFASCSEKLQETHNIVSPPTRFVFSRYRAAWKERESKDVKIEAKPAEEPIVKTSKVAQGRVIADMSNATIAEGADGIVQVTSNDDGTTGTLQLDSVESSSLVVQNLRGCKVSLTLPYQLLHLIDLKDCVVSCPNRIDGAIHITDCTDTKVYAKCHQLRIHETTNLECHVQVGSGPILEDSTEIRFYSNDAVIQETKDFNWFRKESSPNFCILPQEISPLLVEESACVKEPAAKLYSKGFDDTQVHDSDNDDDDDDEL